MSFLKRLWHLAIAILGSTQVRIWHLVVGFLITTGVSIWIAQSNRHEDLLIARSNNLVVTSSDFENRVSAFVSSGDQFDTLNPEDLGALLNNVEQQLAALNQLAPSLKGSQKQLSDDYVRALISVRQILRDGLKREETRDFGMAALEVTRARNALIETLG